MTTTKKHRTFNLFATLILGTVIALVVAIGVIAAFDLDFPVLGFGKKYTRDDYMDDVRDTINRWDDAVAIAESTSRMSLPGQIDRMQQIRRDAANLDIPGDAQPTHYLLLDCMDTGIDAFIAFMAQEDEDDVNEMFKSVNDKLDRWSRSAQKLGQ